ATPLTVALTVASLLLAYCGRIPLVEGAQCRRNPGAGPLPGDWSHQLAASAAEFRPRMERSSRGVTDRSVIRTVAAALTTVRNARSGMPPAPLRTMADRIC